MVNKAWLIAAFAILVLTTTFLGWSIDRSIEHTRDTVCVQFEVEFDLIAALLLSSEHMSEQDAVEILETSAERLEASCR